MSRPGAFRSNPGAAGGWAHLLGVALAMVLPAALGVGLLFGSAAVLPDGPARLPISYWLESFLSMLVISPALTWLVLVPGVPLALWAVRRGRAGWATLALGGGALWLAIAALVGTLLYAAWVSALGPGGEGTSALGGLMGTLPLAAVGACAGLSYWLGLRLAAPGLFRR